MEQFPGCTVLGNVHPVSAQSKSLISDMYTMLIPYRDSQTNSRSLPAGRTF